MILYLDASALVKLYAAERHRELVETAVKESDLVVSALISYAEARAAFWRKERDGSFSTEDHARAVSALDEDSAGRYALLPVGPETVFRAGELAARHRLRGYDAVHLSCALDVRDEARQEDRPDDTGQETGEPQEIRLMTFDKELYRAAKAEKIVYRLDEVEELP